jgi:hypothetical protein
MKAADPLPPDTQPGEWPENGQEWKAPDDPNVHWELNPELFRVFRLAAAINRTAGERA